MVAVFLAQGFEEIEALTIVDILRRGTIEVCTVGVGGKEIVGAHGVSVVADTVIDQTSTFDGFQMLVLPGGMPGTRHLAESEMLHKALTTHASEEKWLAAICAAPTVLGKIGALKGRRYTCYDGFEKEIEDGTYVGGPVVVDGTVVTGRSPGCAIEFALQLVSLLKGAACADTVRKGLLMP
ncbi:DJ-1 family glyoxalase III [Fusibacter sp. JL298sf-3]